MTISVDTRTTGQQLREIVRTSVEDAGPSILELSHKIHSLAEVSWEEHQSASLVASFLRENGFDVTEAAYGVPTSIEAVYGTGELTVVVCAEYDALPEVGHACGHNMIAAAGVGAVLALKPVADAAGLRIKLLGTPAEEHGGGKVALLQAGAWEDAAFSLMVHGATGPERAAAAVGVSAVERFEVQYKGSEAHAAGAPDKAINAGAAASLAMVNMAMLRQHLPANANINAFISHGGGATNVIAGETTLQVEVRAGDIDVWRDLKRRVLACFEGAAIATGCSWSHRQTEHPYAPLNTHEGLGRTWDSNMEEIGRAVDHTPLFGGGSTDMGNVSQVLPALHGMVSVRNSTAVPHHPGFTAAASSAEGDQMVIDGATVMALTVLDAALDPALRAELLELQAAREPGATRNTLAA